MNTLFIVLLCLCVGFVIGCWIGHLFAVNFAKEFTVEEASKFLREKGYWVTLHLKPEREDKE